MKPLDLSPAQVDSLVHGLAVRHQDDGYTAVAGVPRGGIPVAIGVAARLGVPVIDIDQRDKDTLVVDDLVDSGRTASRYTAHRFDALIRKPHSPIAWAPEAKLVEGWVTFPWERTSDGHDTSGHDAVIRLLEVIGEDPSRPGLIDTPRRVIDAFREMTSGYGEDPAEHLSVVFPDSCDEMVVVRDIEFHSLCEHHLLGFAGTATVGYVPGDTVVGLSKLARLVEVYARRLQVQERLTSQIADAIVDHLNPDGVGVVIKAKHSCMGCRGVRKPGAEMVTSSLHGLFRDDPRARAEFLALAGIS